MFYKVPDEDLLLFGRCMYRECCLEEFIRNKDLWEEFWKQYQKPNYKEIIKSFDEQYELCK